MTPKSSVRLTSGMFRGGLVLALALMLGWAPTSVAAQATGSLVGTVRDAASQRPLEAVQVYIGGTGIGALTNAAGRFLILRLGGMARLGLDNAEDVDVIIFVSQKVRASLIEREVFRAIRTGVIGNLRNDRGRQERQRS